jgi:hypothetical protein
MRPAEAPAQANGAGGGAAPAASALTQELLSLKQLDLDELRVRWRKLYRATPPAHLTRPLLLRMVAYKIQANAFGDLDRETARFLDRIAQQLRKGNSQKGIVPPVSEKGLLKPGTVLVREHAGVLHKVTVLECGFSWKGGSYKSLSEAARAITGTTWNGPRFFGLREDEKPPRPGDKSVEARP